MLEIYGMTMMMEMMKIFLSGMEMLMVQIWVIF